MKRLLAVLLGGLGLRALLRRRQPASLGPSPAEDLRARLAAAKAEPAPVAPRPVVEPEPQPAPAAPAAEEPVAEAEPEPPAVEDRRADVHARARRAIDELKD